MLGFTEVTIFKNNHDQYKKYTLAVKILNIHCIPEVQNKSCTKSCNLRSMLNKAYGKYFQFIIQARHKASFSTPLKFYKIHRHGVHCAFTIPRSKSLRSKSPSQNPPDQAETLPKRVLDNLIFQFYHFFFLTGNVGAGDAGAV